MIAIGQSASDAFAATGSPTPQSVNFSGSAAATGSLMIVLVLARGVSACPDLAAEDSKGNHYDAVSHASGNDRVSLFYGVPAVGGSGMSFTITPSEDCELRICAVEWTGTHQSPASVLVDSDAADGSGDPSAALNVTTQSSGDLTIGVMGTAPGGGAFPNGGTGVATLDGFSAQYFIGAAAPLEWSLSFSGDIYWLAVAASFKPPAAKAPYFYE